MAIYVSSTLFEAHTMSLPLSCAQRREVEHAIEVAIALLERADGDPDQEDDDPDLEDGDPDMEDGDPDMEEDDFAEEDDFGDDDTDIRGEMTQYSEVAIAYGIDQTRPIGFGGNFGR